MSESAKAQTAMDSGGIPAAASTFPVEHGVVNLANGALHLEIPIVNYAQRGNVQLAATLVYDSNIWKANFDEATDYSLWEANAVSPAGGSTYGGWFVSYAPTNQSITQLQEVSFYCANNGESGNVFTGVSWIDQHGTMHSFIATTIVGGGGVTSCTGTDGNNYTMNYSASAYATDGSGYYANVSWTDASTQEAVNIYDRSGSLVASNNFNNPSIQAFGGIGLTSGPLLPVDRNGNYPVYANSTVQDALNRTLLTDSGVITETGVGTVEYLDVPVAGGGTQRYTINYEVIPVQTSFGVSYVQDVSGNLEVISSVVLPDGSSYQFGYENNSYGELNSMTLPHGGAVSFNYSTAPGLNISSENATTTLPSRWVQSHFGSDGTTNFVWSEASTSSYSQGGTTCGLVTNQVTTASANNIYKFSSCYGNILLQEIDHGSATSSQVDAIDLYSYDTGHPCPSYATTYTNPWVSYPYTVRPCSGYMWMNITGKTTVLPLVTSSPFTTSLTTDIQYSYSNPGTGIPTSVKQWDYYAAAPTSLPDSPSGLPTRETDTTLGYNVNGALFPTLVQYKSSTGSVVASVNYTYDEAAYMSGAAPSSTPNHNDAYVTGNRGNLTTVSKCCGWNGTSSVTLTSHIWYDDAGTVTAIQDANTNKTTLAYDPTDTFPITITLPTTGSGSSTVSHVISQTFDSNSGQLSSVTDENGQITTYTFDSLGRPYQFKFSNAGSPVTLQTTTYPSANETDISVLQSPGVLLSASSFVDSYGRSVQSVQEGVSTETTYDGQGRLYSVTNPHLSTPSSTDGTTYYAHDELGRVKSVTMPNGYATTYSYAGNTVTVTDALGHSRQTTSDAFGDTTSVLEPNSSGTLALATTYQYNWQSQLTQVSQQGGTSNSALWRTRTFNYDGVGRLISQTTPEAGTMSFGYDNNGNLTTAQNQNATNNTTTTSYDALNRPIQAVVGGGPTYTYTYDAEDSSGDPYGKGRMTSTSNGSNVQTLWQHDALGRIVSSAYCLPSTTNCTSDYQVQSIFDFQGNLTSLTYPDGRQVQWNYNQLNRPLSETYMKFGTATVNTSYASNLQYYPGGQLQQAVLGNGVQVGATYDSDQNLSSLVYVAKGVPIVEKTYSWDKNAGNLLSINDLAAGRTQAYSYDQLDRIATMSDTGTTANACNAGLPGIPPESQTYTIDAWGNLNESGTYSFSQLIGANNQISPGQGYLYDSAGNQTQDGLGNTYQYRADGLMTGSMGETYTYDALGQRVRKDGSTSNEYIYFGGQLLAMRNPSTGAWTDRIYGPGGALATVPNSSQTAAPVYRASDHLGSLNYTLDASGNITGASSALPYGELAVNTTGDNFLFTDHER
ncbi:MAG: hypothetical protein ABSF28_26680, partial [Terracidiphilus sp.]